MTDFYNELLSKGVDHNLLYKGSPAPFGPSSLTASQLAIESAKQKAREEQAIKEARARRLDRIISEGRLVAYAANKLFEEQKQYGLSREDCVRIATGVDLSASIDTLSISVDSIGR